MLIPNLAKFVSFKDFLDAYDLFDPHQTQFAEHFKDQIKAAFEEHRDVFPIVYNPSADYTIRLGLNTPKRVAEDTPRKAKLRLKAASRAALASFIESNPEWYQEKCAEAISVAASKGNLDVLDLSPDEIAENNLNDSFTISYE